jgi:hypothetical protein
MDAVSAALSGLIDYAGLFPPAGLPLDVVADQFGRYRAARHAWMLGRLVVPADRLADAEAAAHRAGASVDEPWRVSALVGTADHSETIAAALVDLHHRPRTVRVEAVEAVAGSADDIARLGRIWPTEFERYVEIPADSDPAPLMAALSAAGLFAKIRAGGVTPDRFPSTAQMARFLVRARDASVPMKATAGLHHALRGDYRLTYEPESARATMHGFLNLVLAADVAGWGKNRRGRWPIAWPRRAIRPEAFKLSGRRRCLRSTASQPNSGAVAQRGGQLLPVRMGSCSLERGRVAEIRGDLD